MPLVSVLCASFRHERFLGKCLSSALAQTMSDLEVIVVDDASDDASAAIARSFDDPRLRVYVNETNIGAYATQQRALDLACGDFVAVLNSDDWWAADKLERQVAGFDEAAFSYCRGELAGPEGEVLGPADHGDWPSTPRHDLLPWLVEENRVLASSVLFRRGEARFDGSWRYCGDWRLLLDLAVRGEARLESETLVYWRQHSGNSYVRSAAVTAEEIRLRRHILARFGTRADLRSSLARCAMHLGALYALVGRMDLAREALAQARRLDPESRVIRRRRLLMMAPLFIARRRLWRGERIRLPREALERF